MRRTMLATTLGMVLALIALGPVAAEERDHIPDGATAAEIVRVYDGDTVAVRILQPDHADRGKTRIVDLIGVDAPSPAPAGSRANCLEVGAALTASRLLPKDQLVWLEADQSLTDAPDRWQRMIWVVHRQSAEPVLANEAMIGRGFARVTIDPDSPYAERLARAQLGAIADQRGLWGGCGDEFSTIRLGYSLGTMPAVQDIDCATFDSQEEAQAVYDADPSDPNFLDEDGDGLACDEFDYGDGVEIVDEGEDDDGTGLDLTCDDFATQEEAQEQLDADPTDPLGLDPDGDGTACEPGENAGGTIDTMTPTGVGTAFQPARDTVPFYLVAVAALLAGAGWLTRRSLA